MIGDAAGMGSGSPVRFATNTTTPAPKPSPMMNATINLATTNALHTYFTVS